MTLILWDLHGEDEYQKVRASYLRGSSGYLLVVDGTRPKTLEVMEDLHRMAEEQLGVLPFVVVINKADISDEWEINDETLSSLEARRWMVFKGSAKTGEGVHEAFMTLSRQMVAM